MVAWQSGVCSRSKACLRQRIWGLENGAKRGSDRWAVELMGEVKSSYKELAQRAKELQVWCHSGGMDLEETLGATVLERTPTGQNTQLEEDARLLELELVVGRERDRSSATAI
eukprot:IDg18343t1